MKVIYVAGKYSGPTHDGASFTAIARNILTAREHAIALMKLGGCVTLVPHLNSYHMELDFTPDQQFWYNADLELLKRSDAIFMLPGWTESKGARIEYEYAQERGIPIFTTLAEVKTWLNAH